ncbi:hypothetical protein [Chroococcidiopsis thermalis]|uniref:Lipoprotein n=1 Tax=Chroococcidiopsis thermalis (strain PCC 7203) TaxID=251229 RepID=K9UA76_CHRTP|nr:hypothetical protein [Chroococcidiopsis thermalis]AFY91301.1 hypothetical protein Chro_5968 [Chroococcidiopsis thermalis PCC 7203]
MQLLRLPYFVLLVAILTACNSQSSSSAAKKELQTIGSWTATAHLLADEWLQGAVPNVYARQTLQKVEKNLQQEVDTLTKADLRKYSHLPTKLQQLQQSVHLLSAAIAQGNRATVTQQIQQLATREQELHRLANSLETQP